MRFEKVNITRQALLKLRKFVKAAHGGEIGGPMVGFISESEGLVITDLTGPGERGRCNPFSVTIDGDHSQSFCDEAYRSSEGLIDYVGDWHCHPSVYIRPSGEDHKAIKLMAEVPGLPPDPVSLIHGKWRYFNIFQWIPSEQRLGKISHRVIDCLRAEQLANLTRRSNGGELKSL